MTLKEKKKSLRTKTPNDNSSPTASDNEDCLVNVQVDVVASQE